MYPVRLLLLSIFWKWLMFIQYILKVFSFILSFKFSVYTYILSVRPSNSQYIFRSFALLAHLFSNFAVSVLSALLSVIFVVSWFRHGLAHGLLWSLVLGRLMICQLWNKLSHTKRSAVGRKKVLPEMTTLVNLGVSVRDLGHRVRFFPSRYPSPFKPGTLTRQWPDAEKSSMLRDVILRDSSMDG